MRKSLLSLVLCLLLLAAIVSSHALNWAAAENLNLTSVETQVMNSINGTNAYQYDLELENIGLNHSLSGYSFRSSGSVGANETVTWIQNQFESFGLETRAESFEFTTWNVMTKPVFKVDLDGNPDTTDDQVVVNSFQPEHYSWPTPEGGVFAKLVSLPMPDVQSRAGIWGARYNATAWNALNTTGKVVLVGREFRMNSGNYQLLVNKLQEQPPAAIIYTYWYTWMSDAPPGFTSTGGRPASQWGAYLWRFHIPAGWIDYEDGQMLRNALANNTHIAAQVTIDASIGTSPHYNVVGKILGSTNPEKMIIISAHYDSVVTPAFCDNGAGIAGVLELARVFSDANRTGQYKPAYTLVFVAFAGEELGLVGSVNYLKQHGPEMKNVVAVMNLDCIGNRIFQITETVTDDNGLNLQGIVTRAGQDLYVDVNYTSVENGASDQETFRAPIIANEDYAFFWGSDAGISNETRVKSSILISSIPLFYNDKWSDLGTPGWIHTPYDNSTSTSTFGWVEVANLQAHIRVTGLSIMRVLSPDTNPFLSGIYVGFAVAGIAAAILIYVKRTSAPARYVHVFMKKLSHEVLVDFGTKELVFVIFLTGVCMFLSFAFFMRVGRDEAVIGGFPTIVTYLYFGKPFEMIAIMNASGTGVVGVDQDPGQGMSLPDYPATTSILLPNMILNAAVFALLAFITIYVIKKLRYLHEYSKSSDVQRELERQDLE